ncbi:PorP/SprF family type IX secretion system membrane protein [Maribacter antarcticus]|uniref:PorP/SprF family type IX secretion system membrane protein n=1 Tax=Maribacter antarcticus TaxID=505250 RepID=UPI00047BB8C1|nr:type IX secretion system membrane protein PorP/SprF [Maribacter antarcticus]
MLKKRLLYLFLLLLALTKVNAQEENPFISYDVPAQNLLKYNRFLINPTFSTVREDKSYINLLHRNQSVQFDDNNQNYFLSYSGRVNDRTGLGLSLYTQRQGLLSNFGVLANYAYGVKLNDKSNLTFGANMSYYNSGFDEGRASTIEIDPLLAGLQDQSLLSIQPGLNLSYGKFDVGVFAENLFDYNLKTSESVTEFKDKTFSGHIQYTHQFKNASGMLEEGRLMPLARARKLGEEDLTLGGSLILDLPKLGWLQAGYDSFYGAAAGVGFNLNRRISLGYTMEKGLSSNFDNFGVTHEISVAYSFTPNLTADRVLFEDEDMDNVENDFELDANTLASNEEVEELKRKLVENDAIIQELMFRQDSLESSRHSDLERRFSMVMRMVRNETNGNNPELERRAEALFKGEDKSLDVASIKPSNNSNTSMDGGNEAVGTEPNKTKPVSIVATKRAQYTSLSNSDTQTRVSIVQDKIKSRRFKDLPEVTDGYYVVANVYKGVRYMDSFLNKLSETGLNPDYIDNPNNGLKYVYLNRFDTFEQAEAAAKGNLNGRYKGPTWIMNVDNRYTNEAYADNVNKLKEKSSKYDTDVLRKNVIVKDKVVANRAEDDSSKLKGLGSGYYLIANVFAVPRNANRFVALLNSIGLSASYFINPKNNYRYVYLKRHDDWSNALISYYSKLNDAYDDKMWIMRVSSDQMA